MKWMFCICPMHDAVCFEKEIQRCQPYAKGKGGKYGKRNSLAMK
jgi:hypothetical protein